MIDDLVPITHDLDGREIRIYAIADVHIGSAEYDRGGFERFVHKIESDPDAFLVIAGDVFDNTIAGGVGSVHENAMQPQEAVDYAAALFAPIAERILAVTGGNHEERSRKAVDLDPLYTTCCMLRINDRYRRSMAFVSIVLRRGGIRRRVTMLVTHGRSKAARNRFQYSVEGVDVLISGHTHDGSVEKPARLVLSEKNKVTVRPLVSIVATSWLRYGGYGMRAMYQPKATSDPQHVVVEWTNSNDNKGGVRVVW